MWRMILYENCSSRFTSKLYRSRSKTRTQPFTSTYTNRTTKDSTRRNQTQISTVQNRLTEFISRVLYLPRIRLKWNTTSHEPKPKPFFEYKHSRSHQDYTQTSYYATITHNVVPPRPGHHFAGPLLTSRLLGRTKWTAALVLLGFSVWRRNGEIRFV